MFFCALVIFSLVNYATLLTRELENLADEQQNPIRVPCSLQNP